MRRLLPVLLPLCLLGGCAGQVRDFVGDRGAITEPQLLRFGFPAEQARCVSQRLGSLLLPRQLRRLVQRAEATQQGFYAPPALTPRDLVWVARTIDDREIVYYLERADQSCGALLTVPVVAAPSPVPAPAEAPAAPAVPVWLNLGAATSGQSIAVDSATINRAGTRRSAWFRLTDPGAQPSSDSFLLDVDCTARTINAKARRRVDDSGVQIDYRDYPDNPLPVEGGTVMEIAWLSLCT